MSDPGSKEADFLQLVRTHEARIRKICRVYASEPDAERDLYQDILVELWRSLDSFNGDAKRSTWLYRVALNTALNHARSTDVRTRRTVTTDVSNGKSPRARPDAKLEEQDQLDVLYRAIDRLDPIDKALVTLYLDERSYADIATVLGLTENHVGVKLHRIKKKLASWLAPVPT